VCRSEGDSGAYILGVQVCTTELVRAHSTMNGGDMGLHSNGQTAAVLREAPSAAAVSDNEAANQPTTPGRGDRDLQDVEEDVAHTEQCMHHKPMDPTQSRCLSAGRSHGRVKRSMVLGNSDASAQSDCNERAKKTGYTATRNQASPVPAGTRGPIKRARTTGGEPRTSTGPHQGTGVANQA
jgi:hypothetical protein